MILIAELLLLFLVIFFAVRLATTGHVENDRGTDPRKQEIVYEPGQLNS